jgi:hypothetical protein
MDSMDSKLGGIQLDGEVTFFLQRVQFIKFSHNGTSQTSFELDLEALNNNFKEARRYQGFVESI